MFLLEKWKAAEQSVSSEMDHISIIHNLANTFKYNMNTTNNDYKTMDEQNNRKAAALVSVDSPTEGQPSVHPA